MQRVRRFYDRICSQFTIENGLLYLVLSVLNFCLAALNIRGSFRTHEAFDQYFGAVAFVMGAIVLFHAIQVLRAVARRNREDGRQQIP